MNTEMSIKTVGPGRARCQRELKIDACIAVCMMGIDIQVTGDLGKSFDYYRGQAWLAAEELGYRYPHEPMPTQFAGEYELPVAWLYGQDRYEQDQREQEAARQLKQLDAVLRGELSWGEASLFSPEEMVTQLSKGERVTQFGLTFWVSDRMVWASSQDADDISPLGDLSVGLMQTAFRMLARGVPRY